MECQFINMGASASSGRIDDDGTRQTIRSHVMRGARKENPWSTAPCKVARAARKGKTNPQVCGAVPRDFGGGPSRVNTDLRLAETARTWPDAERHSSCLGVPAEFHLIGMGEACLIQKRALNDDKLVEPLSVTPYISPATPRETVMAPNRKRSATGRSQEQAHGRQRFSSPIIHLDSPTRKTELSFHKFFRHTPWQRALPFHRSHQLGFYSTVVPQLAKAGDDLLDAWTTLHIGLGPLKLGDSDGEGVPRQQHVLKAKSTLLGWVNQNLADTSKSLSPDNVIAIMQLTGYEMIAGAPDVRLHIIGLGEISRLITADTSECNLFLDILPRAISQYDLMYAVSNNDIPLLSDFESPQPYKHIADRAPFNNLTFLGSPLLYQPRPIEGQQQRNFALPERLVDLLTDAFSCFQHRCWLEGAYHSPPGSSPVSWQNRIFAAKVVDTTTPREVTEACYIAAQIFYRATVELVPFESDSNTADVEALGDLLWGQDEYRWEVLSQTWMRMPFVYQWILMVGSAASAPGSAARFKLVCQLAVFMNTESPLFFDNIWNLLWLQKVIRDSERFPTISPEIQAYYTRELTSQ
ncbi:hypothetical protein BU16DRAFT_612451 [Lophium mytilinum]|uniref:Uncharacterized protein n=1 Tax=Lophium mytilinum TaxID=390894 RepID=A0A6A6REK8_9PEZI|nr:hypothetical protein BU16DRAFT_612451 [Lophium mytilinum]